MRKAYDTRKEKKGSEIRWYSALRLPTNCLCKARIRREREGSPVMNGIRGVATVRVTLVGYIQVGPVALVKSRPMRSVPPTPDADHRDSRRYMESGIRRIRIGNSASISRRRVWFAPNADMSPRLVALAFFVLRVSLGAHPSAYAS